MPESPPAVSCTIAVTGGTGYLGRALIPSLLARGHRVRVLVRPGSERRLPAGVTAVAGNPLALADVAAVLAGADTLVHLVGVPKPSPAKARQFREIDLVSIQIAVAAAARSVPRPHVVYLSVAQPAPVMKAYLAVRREGEELVRAQGLTATFLRPWYVLGPGHRWPMVLAPVYALLRLLPATRASAERLGFVTLPEMVAALVRAVEQPPEQVRIVEVPEIRRG
ncbi:MAG TPA: NAD(P)H-binding protein [Opitutaceae bacterium]|nr:NAD(P)H-binding protein [Opitutaceae bacterium]